jgi:hypothetical protein
MHDATNLPNGLPAIASEIVRRSEREAFVGVPVES